MQDAKIFVNEGDSNMSGKIPSEMAEATKQRRPAALYTKDFDGLRGILSIWIVLFHSFAYSQLKTFVFLDGSVLMTLFFLLSGFGLTLGYSDQMTKNFGVGEPSSLEEANNQAEIVKPILLPDSKDRTISFSSVYWKYMYNRCVRILPIYWICVCFAIPPSLYGYGNFDPRGSETTIIASYVQSFIPTSTWIPGFLLGQPIDGPGWTIATLFAFYFAFPFMIRWMSSTLQTDMDLLYHIRAAFWIQMVVIIVIVVVCLALLGSYDLGFWIATAWPPCRFSVFTMSMAAALLCKRYADSPRQFPWFHQSGQFLPFSFFNCRCIEDKCFKILQLTPSTVVNFENTITSQLTVWGIFMAIWIIIFPFAPGIGSSGSWFQGLSAFAMLDFMVALVRVQGKHVVSKVLTHPVALWLGEVSMALYLVHEPCIYYFYWFQNGMKTLHWPAKDDNDGWERFAETKTMVWWGVFSILPVALVLASFLYYAVEMPIIKRLRSK